MDLYILRHGKAGQSFNRPGDSERKLTADGRTEMRKVARWIRAKKIRFDVIATSPLARATQTAEIVARVLKAKEKVEVWDDLSPAGDPDAVFSRIGEHDAEASVLIVGHEPALSHMIGKIITNGDTAAVILAKGGMAKIRNYTYNTNPSGDLQWLMTPRQMGETE